MSWLTAYRTLSSGKGLDKSMSKQRKTCKPSPRDSVRKRLIIALDGPAGSGKSTAARLIAKKLKIPYIDTGAMYRAVTLKAIKEGVCLDKVGQLVKVAKKACIRLVGKDPIKQKVILDGKDVTKQIRLPELTRQVFYVAREPLIRREMVAKQKKMALRGGAVMEGRDIGTVVFPRADYKFFIEAKPGERAARRFKELRLSGHKVSYSKVLADLIARDRSDRTRKEGPLKQAKDAILVDTTLLTIRGTVDRILDIIRERSRKNSAHIKA